MDGNSYVITYDSMNAGAAPVSVDALVSAGGGGGGGAAWGGITGTLANQADLVAALAQKATALSARLTANRTTTSTAMGNITDLVIPIAAGESWIFECELAAGCNNTGGSQFSLTVPAGSTLKARAFGNTNSATAWTSGQISTSDSAGPTMLNVSAQGRYVRLSGVVVNGATPGAIQARFKSVTNGQTTTVEANSFIKALRI